MSAATISIVNLETTNAHSPVEWAQHVTTAFHEAAMTAKEGQATEMRLQGYQVLVIDSDTPNVLMAKAALYSFLVAAKLMKPKRAHSYMDDTLNFAHLAEDITNASSDLSTAAPEIMSLALSAMRLEMR